MIISHSKRFIFIKTAKTAGSSIEIFLSKACNNTDIVTPLSPPEPGHHPRNFRGLFNPLPELFCGRMEDWQMTLRCLRQRVRFYSHLPARNARCRIGHARWNNYFTFCVERNPWDKTLSHFHMVKNTRNEEFTLDDYFHKKKFCTNYPIYTDWGNQSPMVDRILRYENLNCELGEVCEQLGIAYTGILHENSKRGYRNDRRHYREVFSPSQADDIARAFQIEMDLHGYSY